MAKLSQDACYNIFQTSILCLQVQIICCHIIIIINQPGKMLSRIFFREVTTVQRLDQIAREDVYKRSEYFNSICVCEMSYLDILELQDRVSQMSSSQFKEGMQRVTAMNKNRHEDALSKAEKQRFQQIYKKRKEQKMTNSSEKTLYTRLSESLFSLVYKKGTLNQPKDSKLEYLIKKEDKQQ